MVRESSGVVGLVDYATPEDMKNAIRKLDDSEFRNPFDRWGQANNQVACALPINIT